MKEKIWGRGEVAKEPSSGGGIAKKKLEKKNKGFIKEKPHQEKGSNQSP